MIVDAPHRRKVHRLFCLYTTTAPGSHVRPGSYAGEFFPLDRFDGHFRAALAATPQVVVYKSHDPGSLELPRSLSCQIVSLASVLFSVPNTGYVLALILDLTGRIDKLHDLLATTCFDRFAIRIGGHDLMAATIADAPRSSKEVLQAATLGRDVLQILAVSADEATAFLVDTRTYQVLRRANRATGTIFRRCGVPYSLATREPVTFRPNLDLLLKLIYRADTGHRRDQHSLWFPTELNRPVGSVAAHARGVTVISGAAEHVEHAALLTAVQLVASLTRLRQIRLRVQEALRFIRDRNWMTIQLETRRSLVARLLEELSALELDLSFGVEPFVDPLLIPDIVVDSYHQSIRDALGIKASLAAVSTMVERLSAAVRAQEQQLAAVERARSASRHTRNTTALGYISTVAVPLGLVFAFFSIATTDIDRSTSLVDIGRYRWFYLFIAVVLLVGIVLWLALFGASFMRMRRASRHTLRRHYISAHRGGTEDVQPNTLEAYRQSVSMEADYVEFDVRRTGDGRLVVFHDEHAPSGEPVASMTLGDLRVQVGHDIPEIEQVMDSVRGLSVCQIDLKEVGYEQDVVKRALDIVGPGGFIITTLEDQSVRAIKDSFPEVRVGLSLGRDMSGSSLIQTIRVRMTELFPARRVRACRADFLSIHKQLALLTGLRFCARRSLGAFVWTVNDDKELLRMLHDDRVECVITDRPGRAQLLREAGG